MGKKFIFYIVTFILVLFVFEAFGYLTRFIFDDIYDHRKAVLEELSHVRLKELKREDGIDPVLGWKNRGPKTAWDQNCQGTNIEYTYDQFGVRTYTGYDWENAEVLIAGDSYSHGSEVDNNETYAAQLAGILDVSVANLSVGGYGPAQAFLSLKENIHHYPKSKVVILGIMYENIYRMVNSYRPVLARKSSPYGLKPYILQERLWPYPDEALENIDFFRKYADHAFDQDFWSKPKHKFPFFVSLVRGLSSNYCYFKRLPRKLRKIGVPEYFLAYRSEDFSLELVFLFDLYTRFLEPKNIRPVVIFIPRDKHDTKSVSRFIDKNRERFPKGLLVGDLGTADIDWEQYNLLDTRDASNINLCHPSPYGHRKIAEYIADLLRRDDVMGSRPEQ